MVATEREREEGQVEEEEQERRERRRRHNEQTQSKGLMTSLPWHEKFHELVSRKLHITTTRTGESKYMYMKKYR